MLAMASVLSAPMARPDGALPPDEGSAVRVGVGVDGAAAGAEDATDGAAGTAGVEAAGCAGVAGGAAEAAGLGYIAAVSP